jgi:hypothetical protein
VDEPGLVTSTETVSRQQNSGASQPPSPASTGCPTCAGDGSSQSQSYVYALGGIGPRFPSASVEKEFSQVVGRAETAKLTDRQVLHSVLSKRENRYLARQLGWVFTIQGLETYLLVPRDPVDIELLIESIRPAPRATDIDVVIGVKGPLAPPEMCNGLIVPIVAFDQIYSFDVDSIIESIPRPKEAKEKEFTPVAEELLARVMLMTDNAGATDEHRATNYLCVRYDEIYRRTAAQFAANASLTAVEVRMSPLSGTRKIVDVIFSFRDRKTDVIEKFSVGVDVSEEFPYLTRKWSPFYEVG